MTTTVIIRNRDAVRLALQNARSLAEAAKAVSLSVNQLRLFSWSQGLRAEYRRLELARRVA